MENLFETVGEIKGLWSQWAGDSAMHWDKQYQNDNRRYIIDLHFGRANAAMKLVLNKTSTTINF